MAILNFPSNPTVDDTYEENGITYTWDGDKWTASSSGSGDIYVNVSGDSMTGDLTVPSLNGGPLAGLRNQLINGDFRVWQRGTPVTVSGPTGIGYGPDRWRASINGTTMTRGTGLGVNYPGAFGVRVNVSGGASCSIAQPIELPQAGHFGPFTPGSSWTLSAYFEDPSTASFNVLFATGAVGPGEVWAGGPVKTLDTANGKTRVSQTFVVPSSMDSSRTSCLVVLQDNVNNRVFAQAQFEPGPVATPFEQRPIGLELSLCQRYYFTPSGTSRPYQMCTGTNAGSNWYSKTATFPVTMRTTPSIEVFSEYGEGIAGLLGTNGNNRIAAGDTQVGSGGNDGIAVKAKDTTGDGTTAGFYFSIRADAEL